MDKSPQISEMKKKAEDFLGISQEMLLVLLAGEEALAEEYGIAVAAKAQARPSATRGSRRLSKGRTKM